MATKAAKRLATYRDCPGMSDPYAHTMRDHCWTCAPFWERVPHCPDDGLRLTETGYCKCCRKHFDLTDTGAAEATERWAALARQLRPEACK